MKKHRILKIMGVALTLAMVFSLGAVLIATPVSADPDEWTTYDLPDAGEDGDYFWDNTIAAAADAPGPIDRDIDGYFWAYVEITASGDEILKSIDTEGRGWEVTDFSADVTGASDIVAIICSPEDEEVVYVADVDQVFKTEDGGDAWEEVSDISAATGFAGSVTCLTMGYADDDPYVYAGSADGTGGGDVYFINDVAFGGTWTELDLDNDVYGIGASPDFDNDALVATVGDDNTDSFFSTNVGAAVAVWTQIELEDDQAAPGVSYLTDEASDVIFPDDFDIDDNYEMFIGVSGNVHNATSLGGVYRIYGDTDEEEEILDDVEEDIISLDLVGDLGNAYLLAGEENAGNVWYSEDDGDSWESALAEGINPAGADHTYVICDDDIADSGIGWAAVAANPGNGMHMTMDGGTSWVGISLLDSDGADIKDIAPSPDWVSDDILFVAIQNAATDDEVYRYDGTNWERVWEDTQYAASLTVNGNIDMIDCSPEFGDDETLYAAFLDGGGAAPEILLSEDGGTMWADTRNAPGSLASWVIVDSENIIAGGDATTTAAATVYVTDRQGRRAWDDYEVETGDTSIVSLAVWGDTVIAGNSGSDVYISEDFAETWDIVGDLAAETTADQAAYVGFDTDDMYTIYAASDDVVCRYLDTDDTTLDWEVFTLDGAPTTISGLAVADGCVYVSDAVAADTATNIGAIQRTVNPLDDVADVDETEFDYMEEGLDADAGADEVFDLLYLSEGSTQLWGVDTTADASVIYVIEDLLVGPTTGGVSAPDEDSCSFEWDGFDNATDYEVRVYSDEDMGLAFEWHDAATGDDDPVLNVTDGVTTGVNADEDLDAGTEYWWQVRASAPVNSKWSDVWTFTTLPTTMTIDADQFGPAIGATNVPITPSFGWELITEADHYLFELADNPAFTTPIVSTTTTNPVFELDTVLAYGTNYFWRVMAISGTAESDWATGTFTTMAEPVVAPTPAPPAAAPTLTLPPTQQIAPNYIYAIIGIGAALAVVVIVLIVRTRKP